MTQQLTTVEKKSSTVSVWLDKRGESKLSLMDVLFNRFDAMYPLKFRSALSSPAAVDNWHETWAMAFADEGIAGEEVAIGLKVCRRDYDWPPSLPEFLKACRVPVEPESAHHEAVRNMKMRGYGAERVEWSHPAIYWAACELGTWDLFSLSYDRVKTRWARILNAKLASPCDPVPPNLIALPSPGNTTPDPEKVAQLIAGARSVLKVMPK